MSNFHVEFSLSPWLFLLLIPAIAFTLILYFKVEKRFRKMRRRTVSLVLHIIIFVLAITALTGVYFTWEMENVENELVILVDESYSERSSRERADNFVREIIEANGNRSKYAVVKFGYDQILSVEMGKHRASDSFEDYLNSESPDASATDIRSALSYVWDPIRKTSGGETGNPVITDPKSARILLISDGLQTDRDAMSVARLMALDGVRIDVSFFPANYAQDAWIVDAKYPDRSFDVGENFEFDLSVKSSYPGTFDLSFSDNGNVKYTKTGLSLRAGLQSVKIPYSFSSAGHHELKFGMTSTGDTNVENNVFYTSYDLEENNSILIIESRKGESDRLLDVIMARPDAEYLTVKVVNITDAPQSIEELSLYDEVILVNVSHGDMTKNFENLLYEYVNNRGGGLFTVGGFEKDEEGNVKTTLDAKGKIKPVAHAYNEADMKDTVYSSLLPVKIEEYTPPTALAILIDRSSSMEDNFDRPFEMALSGALAAVDVMSPRDFIGVMTLQTTYHVEMDLTPMTQRSKIIDSIYRVADEEGGSTNYSASIEHACRSLCTMQSVERKHILLLSDGKPGDWAAQYQNVMKKYYDQFGVTITVISVVDPIKEDLRVLAEAGHGGAYQILNNIGTELPVKLRQDLGFEEEYSGAVRMQYTPQLKTYTPVVDKITQARLDKIEMDGFFVSRVKNSDVKVALMAKYVPLYAQWTYGAGKVGSLMVDLEGYFSAGLLDDEETGVPILNNIVSSLMPVMNIRERSLNVDFIADNYHTQANIEGYNHDVETDKKLIAFVKSPGGAIQKFDLSDLSVGGNLFTFENREPGIHDVTVLKVPRSFDVFSSKIGSVEDVSSRYILAVVHAYKAFSYSEEYNASRDSFEEGKALLIRLSTRTDQEGEEKLITSGEEFVSTLVTLHESFDPRYLLIGTALVLFLIEIALRKFRLPPIKNFLQKLRFKKETTK